MDLAQGSLKSPIGVTDLLHCMVVDDTVHTLYLLAVANLFDSTLPLKLMLITVQHNLQKDSYLADGVFLSSDGTSAVEFLCEKPFHEREPDALQKMSGEVQRIVPELLRKSGIPSLQPLLCLTKYTWYIHGCYTDVTVIGA